MAQLHMSRYILAKIIILEIFLIAWIDVFHEPDKELFIRFEVFRDALNFVNDLIDVDIWEFIRSFSHILESEVISL